MVLGAMAVSLSATDIAADVHNTNGVESTQQAIVTDEAKRDACSFHLDGPYGYCCRYTDRRPVPIR